MRGLNNVAEWSKGYKSEWWSVTRAVSRSRNTMTPRVEKAWEMIGKQ